MEDAASLVRDMRAVEAWVDQVKSLEIEVECTWTKPEETIARRKARLAEKFPTAPITPEHFPELCPNSSDRMQIAFDSRRVWWRHDDLFGQGTFDVRMWDGTRAIIHGKYSSRQEFYTFESTPGKLFRFFLGHLTWWIAAPHPFWFIDEQDRPTEEFLGRPGDYEIAGRELYRGIDCHVVRMPKDGHHWYVGVQDHRPYGYRTYGATRAAELTAMRELARKEGQTALDEESLHAWVDGLPEEARSRLQREHLAASSKLMTPRTEKWCLDYKEVAPGRFAPMTMGYSLFSSETGELDCTREMKVVRVAVDEGLPESLFEMQCRDGVQVNDWRYEPNLYYVHKKDRTPEDWQAIVDEASAQQARNKAARDKRDQLLGQPAREFPSARWLNSQPLTLADLRGKVVLIDFFSESCGPCRNDYPNLARLSKNRDSNGIVVLGISFPVSETGTTEKLIKDFDIQYPICIDAQTGTLFAAYGIDCMPYTVVLDRDCRIAAHGSLADVLPKAFQLAHEPAAVSASR